jgi:hypothetical protein
MPKSGSETLIKSRMLRISLILKAFLYKEKNLELIVKFIKPIKLKMARDVASMVLSFSSLPSLSMAVSLMIRYKSTDVYTSVMIGY